MHTVYLKKSLSNEHEHELMHYSVRVRTKTEPHEFLDRGFPQGYEVSLNGSGYTSGGSIYVGYREQLSLLINGISKGCVKHPLYIARDPKGASRHAEGNVVPRISPMFKGEMVVIPERDFKFTEDEKKDLANGVMLTFFYVCDFHAYMGGKVYVRPQGILGVQENVLPPLPHGTPTTIDVARYVDTTKTGRFVPTATSLRPRDASGIYVAMQGGQILRFDTESKEFGRKPFVSLEGTVFRMRMAATRYKRKQFRHLKYPDDFIGLSDERGLIGLAFDPENPNVLFVMVSTETDKEEYDHYSDVLRIEEKSRSLVLRIPQTQFNHNGGHLEFGPDGFLYIGVGDGGGFNDEHGKLIDPSKKDSYVGNGQDLTTLKGKLLRIDVHNSRGLPYAIPSTNPFTPQYARRMHLKYFSGAEIRQEIYAYGLRNPWKFHHDPNKPGDIWIADVGQNEWEEVNILTHAGENFGWRAMEGNDVFNASVEKAFGKAFSSPLHVYSHDEGAAIIGGFALRTKTPFAKKLKDYLEYNVIDQPRCIDKRNKVDRMYVFGDYIGTKEGAPIWVLYRQSMWDVGDFPRQHSETIRWDVELLVRLENKNIHTFSMDTLGNVYVHWRFGTDQDSVESGMSLLDFGELVSRYTDVGEEELESDKPPETPLPTLVGIHEFRELGRNNPKKWIRCFLDGHMYISNFTSSTPQLKAFTNLRVLDLFHTIMEDLNGIEELSQLSKLNIAHTFVSKLEPLESLADSLEVLDVSGCPLLTDVTPVFRLNKLNNIGLANIPKAAASFYPVAPRRLLNLYRLDVIGTIEDDIMENGYVEKYLHGVFLLGSMKNGAPKWSINDWN